MLMGIYLAIAFYTVIAYPGDADGVIVLFLMLALIMVKNIMGHRLYLRMMNNGIHQDGFGVLFFILWIFNLVCFIIIAGMVADELFQENFTVFFQRSMSEILMITSSYLFLLTGLYALVFDVPIEKKVKKQYDASAGLLQHDQ